MCYVKGMSAYNRQMTVIGVKCQSLRIPNRRGIDKIQVVLNKRVNSIPKVPQLPQASRHISTNTTQLFHPPIPV